MSVSSVFNPTLYTPATTPVEKQLALVNGEHPGIWRTVLCTEDSVAEGDVAEAFENLRAVLGAADPVSRVAAYVRVRDVGMLGRVLEIPGVERLQGFVVPKADPGSLPGYVDLLAGTGFTVMPILESHRMFDGGYRSALLHVALAYRARIECVRIGANDLMGHLGIRRSTTQFTIYDTPVGG